MPIGKPSSTPATSNARARTTSFGLLSEYSEISEEDATDRLLQHLNADDLNALNNDQRIILASHRLAPEVTSAAIWLNEKTPGDDLITCVQLMPYRDGEAGSLYIQTNTIIPVPGVDDYVIGIGESSDGSLSGRRRPKPSTWYKNDSVTVFLKGIADQIKKQSSRAY